MPVRGFCNVYSSGLSFDMGNSGLLFSNRVSFGEPPKPTGIDVKGVVSCALLLTMSVLLAVMSFRVSFLVLTIVEGGNFEPCK